jgi:hypothetical protein
VTSRLTALHDRPIPDGQRRAALTASTLLLIVATVLLALTRPTPHAPARTTLRHVSAAAAPSTLSPEAVAVGRAFLAGYLAYAYGRVPARRIADATHALIRSLEAHPPRQTPAIRASRPRVLELHTTPAGPGMLSVRALVNDGGLVDYSLGLLLHAHGGRLLVSALEQD